MTYIVELVGLFNMKNPKKAKKMARSLFSEKFINENNEVNQKAMKAPIGGPPSLSTAASAPGPSGARPKEDDKAITQRVLPHVASREKAA